MPKRALNALLPATLLLAACNPFGPNIKEQIIGRWESETWTRNDRPVFVQFAPTGTLSFMDSMATSLNAEWTIGDGGDLIVTYPAAVTRRCGVTVKGSVLTLAPPTCLLGWDEFGPSVELVKK